MDLDFGFLLPGPPKSKKRKINKVPETLLCAPKSRRTLSQRESKEAILFCNGRREQTGGKKRIRRKSPLLYFLFREHARQRGSCVPLRVNIVVIIAVTMIELRAYCDQLEQKSEEYKISEKLRLGTTQKLAFKNSENLQFSPV